MGLGGVLDDRRGRVGGSVAPGGRRGGRRSTAACAVVSGGGARRSGEAAVAGSTSTGTRDGARGAHRGRRRHRGERGHDHLVARADAGRGERELERGGARRDGRPRGDAPLHVGELGLEGRRARGRAGTARRAAPGRRAARKLDRRSGRPRGSGRRQVPRVLRGRRRSSRATPSAKVDRRLPAEQPRGLARSRRGSSRCRCARCRRATGRAAAGPRCRRPRRWSSAISAQRRAASGWPRLNDLADGASVRRGEQQRVDDVVDVHAVAPLRAVAEQLDRARRAAPGGRTPAGSRGRRARGAAAGP